MHSIQLFILQMKIFFFYFLVILLVLLFTSCEQSKNGKQQDKKSQLLSAAKEQIEEAVLSPSESLKKMRLADTNLEIKLVASEPLINSPVTMAFDDKGRIWVVEMRSFQPIIDSIKHPMPMGRVVILEDTDGDGKMDKSKVFLDSLNVPRAVYIDNEGILLATPPNLWYIENKNDKPGKRILVDPNYALSNNTEAQTNGLFRSLNNWIYNAGSGSSKRYRKVDGKWQIEPTLIRGQWGISQDNFGRLYYNHHSTQLMGDYFMPGLVDTNSFQGNIAGFNELIVNDQRVYPLGPTPGVNNPFREGMLDSLLRLEHFTAACSPLIYRGALLGDKYDQNAFVAEPAGHLIKRNILKTEGFRIIGEQAYKGKEFVSSIDKRFRPVSIKNGPDGALYIVDMYRGVIEDSMWVTPFLKEYAINHDLVFPINTGRIYKIVPKGSNPKIVPMPNDLNELVKLLGSPNGWVRDHAQKKLVEEGDKRAIPILKNALRSNSSNSLFIVHTLWTLEGLGNLDKEDINLLLENNDQLIQFQAVDALTSLIDKRNYKSYVPVVERFISVNDSIQAPHIVYFINKLQRFDGGLFKRNVFNEFLSKYPNNEYIVDALINGLTNKEVFNLQKAVTDSTLFSMRLGEVIENKEQSGNPDVKRIYKAGFTLFQTSCVMCHGNDGNGIKTLGPPLNNSEIVTGRKELLIAILLNGLHGDVRINGKLYDKSLTNGEMPAFKDKLSDREAAGILNYIRHAWNNKASNITDNDVSIIRYETIDRNQPFMIEELLKKYH